MEKRKETNVVDVGSRLDCPDISASELGDYEFCAKSWWLKRMKGAQPVSKALEQGLIAHAAVGARVVEAVRADRQVRSLRWILIALVLLGLLLLARVL
jgi:hypothetical protein